MNKYPRKRKAFSLILVLIIFSSILLTFSLTKVLASENELEIVEESITVEPESEDLEDMSTVVTIRNNGPAVSSLSIKALDSSGKDIALTFPDNNLGIEAYSVSQFEIKFSESVTKTTSGYLIIEAAGVGPAIAPLTLKPPISSSPQRILGIFKPDANAIIWESFLIGFLGILIVSLIGIVVKKKPQQGEIKKLFQSRMSGLKWNFTENWASTFVAVGGVLSTVVGSKIMPEKTITISAKGFQFLNLLFPILIVIAPFLLSALNAIGREPKKNGSIIYDQEGKVPLLIMPFVFGSAVVTWAVIGELMTLAALFFELKNEEIISGVVAFSGQMIFLLMGVLGLFYAWEKIVQTSLTAKTPDQIKSMADTSGIIKASRSDEKEERPVYLP